jgi:hypothetical protein
MLFGPCLLDRARPARIMIMSAQDARGPEEYGPEEYGPEEYGPEEEEKCIRASTRTRSPTIRP